MEEEETIDDLLKDLRENNQQNKIVKNTRLYKKQAVKSNENLANNLNEVIGGSSLLTSISKEPHHQAIMPQKPTEKPIDKTQEKPKGAFRKFMGKNTNNTKINETLLQDYAFMLIPDRNELTEGRMKILLQQISKRNGKVFDFSVASGDFGKFLNESQERMKVVISSKSNLFEVNLCSF